MYPISFSNKKIIFKNKFLKLYTVSAYFKNFKKDYFVTDLGERVGILLLKNDFVLLVKQYRFLLNDYSHEIPGGKVEKNEPLEETAIRECLEETGIKCNSITPFFNYMLGIEMTKCLTHLFYCSDFQVINEFDKREIENIEWIPYPKCIEMIFSGKIRDSMTIVALLVYYNQKLMQGRNGRLSHLPKRRIC